MPVLNDVELAALDLLIAMKKSGTAPAGFIDAALHVNNLGDVAVAAASVAAVAAAAGAQAPVGAVAQLSKAQAKDNEGLSLQQLIDVRARAIQTRGGK
jgi:hypothetical protein